MTPAEHYRAAERLLDSVDAESDAGWAIACAAKAQVHATLALASATASGVQAVTAPAVLPEGQYVAYICETCEAVVAVDCRESHERFACTMSDPYCPKEGDKVTVTIAGATVVECPGWHDGGVSGWYSVTYPHPSGSGVEYATVNADYEQVTITRAAVTA